MHPEHLLREGGLVNETACEWAVVSRGGSVQQYLDLLSVFNDER